MNHSNIEFASLELQRFLGISKNDRDKLRATFGLGVVSSPPMDIATRRRPRAPQPGPVGQVARLSETIVAFAGWYLCGIETAITCVGEKWAFLRQFSGAEVSSVSAAPCWG